MLSQDKVMIYYNSLLFNHYESGGTCEQRVLVLRARFDRILEELTDNNVDSKDCYVDKLQQVYKLNPTGFDDYNRKESNILRKYLNGVQHTKYEADEQQYILSLKRLCMILYLASGVKIPDNLRLIWNQHNLKPAELKHYSSTYFADKRKKLPVALCIDTTPVSANVLKRKNLNRALQKFINDICDEDIPLNLTIYLINSDNVKVVCPLQNKTKIIEFGSDKKQSLNLFLISLFHEAKKNGKDSCNNKDRGISPWIVMMLGQHCLDLIDPLAITDISELNKQVTIIPVGLTSGMQLIKYKKNCTSREALILQEGKEEEFLNWLSGCFKNICIDNK